MKCWVLFHTYFLDLSRSSTNKLANRSLCFHIHIPSTSVCAGLSEQIRELREVIELPLLNPELFKRVGITPPKVYIFCVF
jgi:SpoVK/Ycf46/Vps4 family AAA+-type ATPase